MPQDNDTVEVHYHGTLDNGEVFDSSREREPFSFVVGTGDVISGFDSAVRQLKVGETITVRMEPEEAYGVRRDDYVLELPISLLQAGLELGDPVVFENGARGVITDVSEENFTVDANHWLAGEALTFEIELVSIKWR